MADHPNEPKSQDLAILCGPTEDGAGVKVLRARPGQIEAGEVRPMKEGRPLAGEVVRLVPRKDAPLVCDVEVVHGAAEVAEMTGRPAVVATRAFRDNWERIFGAPEPEGAPDPTLN